MGSLAQATYKVATAIRGEFRVGEHLRELQLLQSCEPQLLADRQDVKLRQIMDLALATSEHYRRLGLRLPAAGEAAREVLLTWPLLEKRTLQIAPSTVRTNLRLRSAAKSTGGSTGAPVTVIKNADGIARERAATWLALGWFGVRQGDRSVRIWGTPLTSRKHLRYRLADVAMNRRRLSAFDFDGKSYEKHWSSLQRFQPVWLYGYASAIHMFAQWINSSGRQGAALGIKLVVPTAEPLSTDMTRDIHRAFSAPVQNEYGCGETGAFAYSCVNGNLHVMSENVHVEIITDDGRPARNGEAGEVVITDLTNLATPLIRYRLGDRATPGSACSCGLPFPTIGPVHGRARDIVVTPKGAKVYGGKIHYHMSEIGRGQPGFEQYQFFQRDRNSAEVRVVTQNVSVDKLQEQIAAFALEHLDGMTIKVRKVPAITREPNGKLRVVMSSVVG